jgi:hypothetical protein
MVSDADDAVCAWPRFGTAKATDGAFISTSDRALMRPGLFLPCTTNIVRKVTACVPLHCTPVRPKRPQIASRHAGAASFHYYIACDIETRMANSIITSSATLAPLPVVLRRGLAAVSALGFLSFFLSTMLLFRLAYRLVRGTNKTRMNQFVILIFNLILADVQQSVAFMLNVQWLRRNAVAVGTSSCWAQGWFVSTGDLSSGLFTLAIAIHSYADIVHDYRLGHRTFLAAIVFLWIFDYMLAVIGVALHPADIYVRAGAWCWLNNKYSSERLWLHYLWILIAEFATVIIYTSIFTIIRQRVASSFYDSETKNRANHAAKLIIAYPIIYVICTLPLVIARLMTMADQTVTFVQLCVAGAMITSNGWLDVLLYSITRRALLFGAEMAPEKARAIDTFRIRPDDSFGNITTIEANGVSKNKPRQLWLSTTNARSPGDSQENLFELNCVKMETVVRVCSDVVAPVDSETCRS